MLLQRIQFLVYIVVLLGYFLSPLDIIPEVIFGVFGMVDDILVGLYVIIAISSVFYQMLVDRNRAHVRAR